LNRRKNNKGFTIIELVVTTSILVIITVSILASYPKFRETVSLKKTVQEAALAVRKAQSYGLGVREFGGGTNIYPGYGAHFDTASQDSFLVFADVNGNNKYDGPSEDVETFKIQTAEKISDICANVKISPPGTCGLDRADIIFYRPKPLVVIMANDSVFSDVEIKISSASGQVKTIVVLSSGQISTE
jgi:prepilin-type N-terminal cleavage/methylation domain-containing protein